MYCFNPKSPNFAKLVRKNTDEFVQSQLALDLRDVDQMVKEGRPVSLQNANDFFDGMTDADFTDLRFEQQRGVDLNDVWNESKRSRKMLSKAKISKVDVQPVKS